ncbi:MAG: cyanophycinase, partial [Bacteroidia bacterium]
TPKGKLLIIGGAEHKGDEEGVPEIKTKNRNFKPYEILGELLPPDHRMDLSIELITTASQIPAEMGKTYIETFARAGFSNVGHMNIGNKDEARDPELIKRVANAHAVLFTGGDQFRLATILGGTKVIKAITDKYFEDEDFIVAGTSAGAMVMSQMMIFQGDNNEALLKGDVKISSGFGLLDTCIIDTHFVKRGRFGRLAQAVIMNPLCTGIGLGEDTALVITRGNKAECRGSGMVIIIDGKRIRHTNLAYIEENTAVCVEGLKVHILAKGNGFLLNERKFIPSEKDIALEKKLD